MMAIRRDVGRVDLAICHPAADGALQCLWVVWEGVWVAAMGVDMEVDTAVVLEVGMTAGEVMKVQDMLAAVADMTADVVDMTMAVAVAALSLRQSPNIPSCLFSVVRILLLMSLWSGRCLNSLETLRRLS